MEPVRSPRNPRIVAAARLHRARERKIRRLTLLEGPHLLEAAIAAGVTLMDIFVLEGDEAALALARQSRASVTPVGEAALTRLAATEHPRGPVAVMAIPEPEQAGGDTLLMAVTEPGNAGTLIRSAAAFGFAVAATEGAVDLWSPKVLRAGAGGHFHAPIVTGGKPPGPAVKLVPRGGIPLERAWDELAGPVTLVVGHEVHGIPQAMTARAVAAVSIPMQPGPESLNAAIAGSIAMYSRFRRREAGDGGDLAETLG